MKKFFFLAAIASVALAGCTKNEPVKFETPDAPISFVPISHKASTKALISSTTYPTDHKFNVWSVFSENDLAFAAFATASNWNDFIGTSGAAGAAFAHAGTSPDDYWAGDGTAYYWPRAGKLSFVAFSPSSVSATYNWTSHAFGVAAYTVNQTDDLMYSDITANKTRYDYTPTSGVPYDDDPATNDTGFGDYKGVNILFHHALALVQFKVVKENTAANETITVKSIALVNPYKTGTLTATHTAFNAAGAVWGTYADETASVPFYTNTTGQDVTTTATNVPSSLNGTAQTSTANDFIVLPQQLAHTSNDVEVAVTFTSKVGSVTSPEKTLNIKLKNGQISAANDHTEWLPNKRYIYTIKFVADQIICDPKVVDYDADINVTLPELTY